MSLDLRVNAFGMSKAERFRKHYGYDLKALNGESVDYINVHDYLHTVTGATPTWHDDEELRVVEYEDQIRKGLIPLPRGLKWVEVN